MMLLGPLALEQRKRLQNAIYIIINMLSKLRDTNGPESLWQHWTLSEVPVHFVIDQTCATY